MTNGKIKEKRTQKKKEENKEIFKDIRCFYHSFSSGKDQILERIIER